MAGRKMRAVTSSDGGRPSLAQRQRERRSEEIRAEITDAAIVEFAQKGFHEASLAHIAERLGTGPSTIYNYFTSKREILEYVVEVTTIRLLSPLVSMAAEAPESVESFRGIANRFGNALSDIAATQPDILRLMAIVMTMNDDELRDRWLIPLRAAVTLVEDFLAKGVRNGELRADLDAKALATAIAGIPFGILLTNPDAEPEVAFGHAMVRAVVGMIGDGIAKPA